ncbi:polynucleotide adenylyltransferase PcnB [Thioalkalivibrio sp.]|uniref:polynucleotide adenylyltransferase PcnB n=1 Tax=Thioalkalivibrio sp. TaxID=2093813 RepID=UPI00356AB637
MSQAVQAPVQPRVYSRDQHPISRAAISDNALKVLYRLRDAGFRSCLVGGGVRDLLLGREPKDFDVATDAHPEDVRRLFRNCRLIGRRFRLAHVTFGREIIEVATFRAPFGAENEEGNIELSEDGRILRDNSYGTIEQDAWRRDFTINALYYDIANYSVLDFTNGVIDLHEGVLRLIGDDPEQRLREDPVRMLRAVRFGAKLGLRIAPEVDQALHRFAGLLTSVAPARLFDEVIKLFHSGAAVTCLDELERFGLFEAMFPQAAECFADPETGPAQRDFLVEALKNTDARIRDGMGVHPAFLYAAILWAPVRREAGARLDAGEEPVAAWQQAGSMVLERQVQRVSIPKRYSLVVREIWELQQRLPRNQGGRALKLLGHPRFRAGYDFLCLRARAGEADPELCAWWTEFQDSDAARQQQRPAAGAPDTATRPRRGRSRRRPRAVS